MKPKQTRYSNYDPIAWVYNKYWGPNVTAIQVPPVLEKFLLPYLPPGARILDLCCGTGHLAQVLIKRGYRVTGLDGSEEMLRFARENAPGGEFLLGDARDFQLPAIYQAAVSTSDSLNYIMNLEVLKVVFRNVYAALREGGLFLFDLNTESGYKSRWPGASHCPGALSVVEEDYVFVILWSGYDSQERRGRFDHTLFLRQDGWQRSDFPLFPKYYTEGEVRSGLEAAGFKEIRAYTYDAQWDKPLSEEANRALFVCRKPMEANAT